MQGQKPKDRGHGTRDVGGYGAKVRRLQAQAFSARRHSSTIEFGLFDIKPNGGKQHTDSSTAETIHPAHLLAKGSANNGRQEGAEVDSHVKYGEGRVLTRIVIGVKSTYNSGDVGLKKSVAGN